MEASAAVTRSEMPGTRGRGKRPSRSPVLVGVATLGLAIVVVAEARSQLLATAATGSVQCGPVEIEWYEFAQKVCAYPANEATSPTVITAQARLADGLATATAVTMRQSTTDAGGVAHAVGAVVYEFRPVQISIPLINRVPVSIEYELSARGSGLGGGGYAEISVGSPFASATFTDHVGYPDPAVEGPEAKIRQTEFLLVAVGATLRVVLTANAIGNLVADTSELAVYGSATADPRITFDQAALDAELGEDSFPLEDYYRLEFSPGITNRPLPFADGFESGTTEAWSAVSD